MVFIPSGMACSIQGGPPKLFPPAVALVVENETSRGSEACDAAPFEALDGMPGQALTCLRAACQAPVQGLRATRTRNHRRTHPHRSSQHRRQLSSSPVRCRPGFYLGGCVPADDGGTVG